MNLFDLVNPTNIVTYYDTTNRDQSRYFGEYLFPKQKRRGIKLEKIKGYAGLPVVLTPSAFDTQATFRDRTSVEIQSTSMPFFRERMKIDETTRQEIMAISNENVLQDILAEIFDDTNELIRGARAQRERMVMELISTGKINVVGNGVKFEYDYKLNKKQKVKPAVNWDDADNATPITDMMQWLDQFRIDYHQRLTRVVMTTKTFNLIKASKEVRVLRYPDVSDTALGYQIITNSDVSDIIARYAQVQVLIDDEAYQTQVGGAAHQFFPDNVVTFLPEGTLGNIFMGTTPEEADLLGNSQVAGSTQIVDTGVAVYTRTLDHPVNVETIVSQICLPSFNADVVGGAGQILIANVA